LQLARKKTIDDDLKVSMREVWRFQGRAG
jgi:hypothetical protein